jgi:hypothetical protein
VVILPVKVNESGAVDALGKVEISAREKIRTLFEKKVEERKKRSAQTESHESKCALRNAPAV